MEKERIICAAILFDNGGKYPHQPVNINHGFVIAGMRHHDCLVTMAILSDSKTSYLRYKQSQGFITTKNRFVSREIAAKIAKESGQTKIDVGTLFSEDLY